MDIEIVEISEQEWLQRKVVPIGKEAVYFFTPLCGTCKLGEQMLRVVKATGGTIPLVKINVNFAPALRERWRIESVPALFIVEQGKVVHKEYALQSVTDLYRLLSSNR